MGAIERGRRPTAPAKDCDRRSRRKRSGLLGDGAPKADSELLLSETRQLLYQNMNSW